MEQPRLTSSAVADSGAPTEPIDGPLDGQYGGPVRIRGALRRLLLWMIPAYAALFIVGAAISSLLLGLQVLDLDPDKKVENLAIVVTVGAVVSLVGQPLGGMLSDRTRSRFGRRAPWIVGGSLFGGLAVVAMGMQTTIVGIAICWGIAQTGYTMANGPLTAVIPDRVPRLARGTFAAFTGLGAIFAGILGSFLGSGFSNAILPGYAVVATLIVVAMVLFCVANPDRPSHDLDVPPWSIADVLRAFWVNPLRHPDFFWAFLGRFLLFVGFGIVQGYSLYLLSDYIGLGRDGAAAFVPWMTIAGIPTGLAALLIGGRLSDRLQRRKPFIFCSSAIIGLGMIVPLVWPTPIGMLAMTAILGLGFGVFQSVDTALVTEVLPSSASYAKDLGIVNIASALPGTLVPAIAGLIIGLGGYGALFPVGIVLAIAASFAVLPIRSVR